MWSIIERAVSIGAMARVAWARGVAALERGHEAGSELLGIRPGTDLPRRLDPAQPVGQAADPGVEALGDLRARDLFALEELGDQRTEHAAALSAARPAGARPSSAPRRAAWRGCRAPRSPAVRRSRSPHARGGDHRADQGVPVREVVGHPGAAGPGGLFNVPDADVRLAPLIDQLGRDRNDPIWCRARGAAAIRPSSNPPRASSRHYQPPTGPPHKKVCPAATPSRCDPPRQRLAPPGRMPAAAARGLPNCDL